MCFGTLPSCKLLRFGREGGSGRGGGGIRLINEFDRDPPENHLPTRDQLLRILPVRPIRIRNVRAFFPLRPNAPNRFDIGYCLIIPVACDGGSFASGSVSPRRPIRRRSNKLTRKGPSLDPDVGPVRKMDAGKKTLNQN